MTSFSSNSNTLLTKFYNLINSWVQNPNQIRMIVEALILRSLRVKNGMSEYFLLLALKNTEGYEMHAKIVE